jgi:hypothetical protein
MALFAPPAVIEREVERVLASYGSGSGHVFTSATASRSTRRRDTFMRSSKRACTLARAHAAEPLSRKNFFSM